MKAWFFCSVYISQKNDFSILETKRPTKFEKQKSLKKYDIVVLFKSCTNYQLSNSVLAMQFNLKREVFV